MNKKVFVINRSGCQVCEMLGYELKYVHNIDFTSFSSNQTPEIFGDFQRHFRIDRFPVVQVDNGKDLITIHWDSAFIDNQSGPGGKPQHPYIKVNSVLPEMVNKTLELLKD